ncbi:MAG TPA: hypothetical protein VJN93_15520 [Candidatus Acidoferrum sp.]|nr:hypothetical protein [Candidatus Acidoferrum sp.]
MNLFKEMPGETKPAMKRFGWLDGIALLLIACFGVMQFHMCQSSKDFLRDDVFYADAAQSMLHGGFYGINGHTETNQPPGTSAILAALCWMKTCSHGAYLRAMTVFGTLGMAACFLLLRSRLSNWVAAAICLLIISSPLYFDLATLWVFPALPYLLFSICALLAAQRLEEAKSRSSVLGWMFLLAALVTASLMVASAAIAVLGAIVARMVLTWFRDKHLAFSQLKRYFAVLLIGFAVQGAWMARKPAAPEWPLPGYPRPYIQQLKVISGNYPELGLARLQDIPIRVARNAFDASSLAVQIVWPGFEEDPWVNVLILLPALIIFLTAVGWGADVLANGGSLLDWYFAGYAFIYLFWPWNMEIRFLLPVVPLQFYYVWRGVHALTAVAKRKPIVFRAMSFFVCLAFALCHWFWLHETWRESQLLKLVKPNWISLMSTIAAGLLIGGALWASLVLLSRPELAQRIHDWLDSSWMKVSVRVAKVAAAILVLALVGAGAASEWKMGWANLDPNSNVNQIPKEVKTFLWMNQNLESGAILMARDVPTCFHYTRRKVIWFPPSTNPELLMQGIVAHHVNYLLVAQRRHNYYLPPDADCFRPLFAKYPMAFQLIYDNEGSRIYKVSS